MKTFTCGFDMDLVEGLEINFDERPQAKFIADYFDLDFFDIVLSPGDMEQCHKSLIWHIDEPRIGQSYPNYYAAKLASQHVKVVLSGTGGDEIFAGYPWRYDWIKNGSDPFDESSGYFIFWRRLIGNEDFKTLMQPLYSKNPQFSPKEVFSNVFGSDHLKSKRREDLLNQTLRFEAKTFLHSLLLLEDKISMAHSLESRVPFLDNDLVDFAMKCPASIKLAANFKPLNFDENKATRINNKKHLKTKAGKLIIREALRGSAPEVFRNATKQGFSGPDSTWYRGKSISFVEHFLSKKEAILYNFLDRATVRKYFDEHISGVKNHRLLIWSLISFEQFLQNFYSSET
jgi:asparagine synthase (glutamine-hydrolysing)